MNIIIFGYGTAGKYYSKILLKKKEIKKIFIVDKIKQNIISKKITQINYKEFVNNKIKFSHAMICTPSGEHFKYAYACIKKNIHTLVEKPFVLKLEEAKKLIKISKERKIKCWTALQNRYNKAIIKLKKKVNLLGPKKISLVDCSLFWNRSKKYYSNNWRGKYSSDGGVLTNQAIHLLDSLIYIFGEIESFNSIIDFNKKKLQAEDQILINLRHKSKVLTSFKATTRANQNYQVSIDVISNKSRFKVRGVSLNLFLNFYKNDFLIDKKNSEQFSYKAGAQGGMGNGHIKILKEFLSKRVKKSSKKIEIDKNYYVLKTIHSIYNTSKKNNFKVLDKQSILGL